MTHEINPSTTRAIINKLNKVCDYLYVNLEVRGDGLHTSLWIKSRGEVLTLEWTRKGKSGLLLKDQLMQDNCQKKIIIIQDLLMLLREEILPSKKPEQTIVSNFLSNPLLSLSTYHHLIYWVHTNNVKRLVRSKTNKSNGRTRAGPMKTGFITVAEITLPTRQST